LNMYSFLHPIQSFSSSPALMFPCVVDLGHSSRGSGDGSPFRLSVPVDSWQTFQRCNCVHFGCIAKN
jgi:hypothetical protein